MIKPVKDKQIRLTTYPSPPSDDEITRIMAHVHQAAACYHLWKTAQDERSWQQHKAEYDEHVENVHAHLKLMQK